MFSTICWRSDILYVSIQRGRSLYIPSIGNVTHWRTGGEVASLTILAQKILEAPLLLRTVLLIGYIDASSLLVQDSILRAIPRR